jgi:hypothetical protein
MKSCLESTSSSSEKDLEGEGGVIAPIFLSFFFFFNEMFLGQTAKPRICLKYCF